MAENPNETILIVEDDVDVADMLSQFFCAQGYHAHAVYWGEDGLKACVENSPNLVVLDIRLPDIDGFEVARRLRTARRTRDIPIIFLTERRERADRLRGLELHADDYMTKPFDIQELRLRVRNSLERARRAPLNHPVTGLPEGDWVDRKLEEFLQSPNAGILLLTLDNLVSFREMYGFVASDDMLRAMSFMINDAIRELGTAEDFLGQLHLGDFLIITYASNREALKDRLGKRLEQSFDYFYRSQDLTGERNLNQGLALKIQDISSSDVKGYNLKRLKDHLEQIAR